MLLGGGFAVLTGLVRGSFDPIGMVFFGGMAILGVVAIGHGLRAVVSPGGV